MSKQIIEHSSKLISWIREEVKNANAKGVIIGISGGIDSSLVTLLAKKAFPKNSLGVWINYNNINNTKERVDAIVNESNIDFKIFDISKMYDNLVSELEINEVKKTSKIMDDDFWARKNLLPRLRSSILYYYARKNNYLVLSTTNKIEFLLGYFTKHGDIAGDIYPLLNMSKSDVYDMSKTLGMNDLNLNSKASADLWEGQVDESELGISYKEIDMYINGSLKDLVKINYLEKIILKNKHKTKIIAPKF